LSGIKGQAVQVSGPNTQTTIATTTIDKTTGTGILASGSSSRIILTSSTISETSRNGIEAAGINASLNASDFVVTRSNASAIVASGVGAVVVGNRGQISSTTSDSVVVSGSAAVVSLASTKVDTSGNNGALISGSSARFYLTGGSLIANATNDAVSVTGSSATVLIQDSVVQGSGRNGVSVFDPGSEGTQVTLLRANIRDSGNIGVYARFVTGTNSVVQILGTSITGAALAGVASDESNVDIGRENLTTNTGKASSIANAGAFGVTLELNSRVQVRDTAISGVVVGIDATNSSGTSQLIATGNSIATTGSGAGIAISGNVTAPSGVRAQLLSNRITTTGSAGITLVTLNPPAAPAANPKVIKISDAGDALALGAVNFGTTVAETPVPNPASTPQQPTLVDWNFTPYPVPPPAPSVPVAP
jgi:hypothetical protein